MMPGGPAGMGMMVLQPPPAPPVEPPLDPLLQGLPPELRHFAEMMPGQAVSAPGSLDEQCHALHSVSLAFVVDAAMLCWLEPCPIRDLFRAIQRGARKKPNLVSFAIDH